MQVNSISRHEEVLPKPNSIVTRKVERVLPNQPLQLTAGTAVFNNVFWFAADVGLSNGFRQTPAATELGSLGDEGIPYK